jgi:hypothetical protein
MAKSGVNEPAVGEERKVLKTGEALSIPGSLLHGAVALAEAEVLDIFTPIRVDLVEKLLCSNSI